MSTRKKFGLCMVPLLPAMACLTGAVAASNMTDEYLEVRIVNHKNNQHHALGGDLYMYLMGNTVNNTDIDTIGVTPCTGLGVHSNGTGVSYLVDSYGNGTDMPHNVAMPNWFYKKDNYPTYHAFRLRNHGVATDFTLGFGCQSYCTVDDINAPDQSEWNYAACLAPNCVNKTHQEGHSLPFKQTCQGFSGLGADNPGENLMGWNRPRILFEFIYDEGGLSDKSWVNLFGLRAQMSFYANVEPQNFHETPNDHFHEDGQTFYRWQRFYCVESRKRLMNKLVGLIGTDVLTAHSPKRKWITTNQPSHVTDPENISINQITNFIMPSKQGVPLPPLSEKMKTPHGYMSALRSDHGTYAEGVMLRHPVATIPSDGCHTHWDTSNPKNSFNLGKVYFPSGGGMIGEFSGSEWSIIAANGSKNLRGMTPEPSSPLCAGEEIEQIKIIVASDDFETFVNKGDPGPSGVVVSVTCGGVEQHWNYGETDNFELSEIVGETSVSYNFSEGIKTACGHMSRGVLQALFGNHLKVYATNNAPVPSGKPGSFYATHQLNNCSEVMVKDLTTGDHEMLIPHLLHKDVHGNTVEYANPVANALTDMAIASENMAGNFNSRVPLAGYVNPYSDSWMWGNPQFGAYTSDPPDKAPHRRSIIWIFIPELDCEADLDASGQVDIDDILTILSHWDEIGGDITGDGVTDVSDLLAGIDQFYSCTPLIEHESDL